MSEINRRAFLGSVAAAVPAAALAQRIATESAKAGSPLLDETLLLAVAGAILPGELEPETLNRVVTEFQGWLEAYQPVAELNHGYGTDEIQYTPADPAPGWQSQLDALEMEARQRFNSSFAELDVESRRDMVRRQLTRDRVDRFPRPHLARHVAVGLLSYYYATPEAADLCYRRAIGKNSCRPLARSPEEPAPLGGAG